jgi:competence protein ComEC
MSPSTQRAVVMVWVFLMTFLLQREQDPINTLCVAALIILTVHPPSLFSISFQLSFMAVFSIIYGFDCLEGKKDPHRPIANGNTFQKTLRSYIYASVFAILGTLPFIMRYFNQISQVSLFGNLLAVPLIGIVVVPLSLLSAFLYPISHHAAAILLYPAEIILSVILYLLKLLSGVPYAAIKTITPSIVEMVCFYLLGWALLAIAKRNGGKRKLALRVVVIVSIILCIDGGYWMYRRHFHPNLRATIIDVGQGSAALLEFPGGKNMLIDGGGFSDNSTFDVGARIIAPYLWRNKITTIDTLILTHPNSDHLHGLLYIAEHFNVKQIWTNSEPGKTMGFSKLLDIVQKNKISMPPYNMLPRIYYLNGARLEILYPSTDFQNRKKTEKWRSTNNNSLVVRILFGATSLLFPGDIEKKAEAEIVQFHGESLKSTLLISPHHGSLGSSSEEFLEKVSPEWVIISSGWRNRFGFPHPSVVERYKKHGCRIINTAHKGAVTISTDGRSTTVKPFIEME